MYSSKVPPAGPVDDEEDDGTGSARISSYGVADRIIISFILLRSDMEVGISVSFASARRSSPPPRATFAEGAILSRSHMMRFFACSQSRFNSRRRMRSLSSRIAWREASIAAATTFSCWS